MGELGDKTETPSAPSTISLLAVKNEVDHNATVKYYTKESVRGERPTPQKIYWEDLEQRCGIW